MTEMNNITISNLYQHPGERLLRWMSVKGERNISDFKAAIENISNELGIEKWLEVKFFSYERLLNTYINLLHIERERTKWNIAKSSINILPGINNKAVLTGSRNEVLINNLLENSLKEEESYSIYLIESGLENVLKNGIDLSKVFDAVHQANMDKKDKKTGKFIKRNDGKILKPEGWKPANIVDVLSNGFEEIKFD